MIEYIESFFRENEAYSSEESEERKLVGKKRDLQRLTYDKLYAEDKNILIQLLDKYHQDDKLYYLSVLIEDIRGSAVLYYDEDETLFNHRLLKKMLQISLELLENPLVFTSNRPSNFIHKVYDIIFHKVRFDEYSDEHLELFFKLSSQALEPKYQKLAENSVTANEYEFILYFIEMTGYSRFIDHPKKLIEIAEKLIPLLDVQDEIDKWTAIYKQFKTK